MNSIKVCEYSRSRSFHDDLILQDQASGERSQDQWSSGLLRNNNNGGGHKFFEFACLFLFFMIKETNLKLGLLFGYVWFLLHLALLIYIIA